MNAMLDKGDGRPVVSVTDARVSFGAVKALDGVTLEIGALPQEGRDFVRPQLFDVMVMDEATQCDIASALPAFQRAQPARQVDAR